jgi:hypothetical protein
MKQFIAKFQSQIQRTLSGFDRVVFRGSLRRLTHPQGMKMYLIREMSFSANSIRIMSKKVSQEVRDASLEPFRRQQLPIEYIRDPKMRRQAWRSAIGLRS